MKVRVLYPSAFTDLKLKKAPAGGDVVELDKPVAEALIEAGYGEAEKAKVEKATQAPGEERAVKAPRKVK